MIGGEPDVIAIAPGRVNLIGDHVDYAGGQVLPIAIERSTAVAIAPTQDPDANVSRIYAIEFDQTTEVDLTHPVPPRPHDSSSAFLNYICGPIEQIRATGVEIPQLDMTIASSVPMGGGLSSSAALEVSVLLGMRTLLACPVAPLELTLEAQRAEHTYAGTPCGIMDMYVSVAARAGHACLIDCVSNTLRQISMPSEQKAIVLVTDTATRHALSDGAYADRRKECEEAARSLGVNLLGEATIAQVQQASLPDPIARRARHVIEEIQRVSEFARTLEESDLEMAGSLMFESHESLRTQFEVSCSELDLLVETAMKFRGQGLYGCRMTGGGFGGCTVTLCTKESAPMIAEGYSSAFVEAFGRPAVSFTTRAADGAIVVSR